MTPEQIAKKAKETGIPAIALTDINNSSAIPDFVKACNKNNIKPIAGIDFRNKNDQQYIGLAKNKHGFHELNLHLSEHIRKKEVFSKTAPRFDNAYIIYPPDKAPEKLQENEFIGIRPEEANKFLFHLNNYPKSKIVSRQAISFMTPHDFELHKNLRAIDNNTLLTKLKAGQLGLPGHSFIHPDTLRKHFDQLPQLINNSEKLIESCSFAFDFKSLKNKKTFTGSRYDDKILLEKLALDGLQYRYNEKNTKARERIFKELEIIDKLGFSAYFLITWDIIRYSMSRGFYHVGRGSGANSIVAYCLKITNVDPIELDLYFERFINPRRSSPPDFDIDYSWKERDEIQDYIFKRYGTKHTALLGTCTTFKDRSPLRELGKVYGLPKQEIDELSEDPEKHKDNNHITKHIYALAKKLTHFPNIRSIHAGGILISEKPITYYTALDMPPKGFPTTQWDMYVAEDIGFEKLDILSQRGIGHIKETAEIVQQNRGIKIDIHRVEKFKSDGKVKKLLKTGKSIGCFYIESPAMRGLLKKLRCDNYLTLVAASSIIRPGVARSGMMREYIRRFHQPDKIKYLHPVMEEQLRETFGVMVYQEDVLKICHHFAGLDLADADVLRRAMSGKFRSRKELECIINKFFDYAKKRGHPDEIVKELWRQIDSFAGYSFSKAHSASYAVESMQSLFLKAYFPLEFMVAVINNFGGFYRTWVYFNEAKCLGGNIELPCINSSYLKTSIKGKNIFMGFVHVGKLESKFSNKIIDERIQNGSYENLEDFINRVHPGIEQLITLIRTNALRFTGKTKARLLWEAHSMLSKHKKISGQGLFPIRTKKFSLPPLDENNLIHAYDEIEILGFPVSMSYFDLLQTSFRGEVPADKLADYAGKEVRMLGTLVTIKYVRTIKNQLMHFGTFIDTKGRFFDTVHFPDSLKTYPFRGMGVYLILGQVTVEFGQPGITVKKMAKLPFKKDPRE